MQLDLARGLMETSAELPSVDELLNRPRWQELAACRGMPVKVFVTGRGESVDEAKAVCGRCDVVAECLEYALGQGDTLQGVWGGTSHQQRRVLRRRQGAETLPAACSA